MVKKRPALSTGTALRDRLAGRWVPSLEEERERVRREPMVAALREGLRALIANASLAQGRIPQEVSIPSTDRELLRERLAVLTRIPDLIAHLQERREEDALAAARSLTAVLQQPRSTAIVLAWAVLAAFDRWARAAGEPHLEEWWEKWGLREVVAEVVGEDVDLVGALVIGEPRSAASQEDKKADSRWQVADTFLLRRWLGVHEYEGVTYFRKEPFEMWVGWMFFVQVVETLAVGADEDAWVKEAVRLYRGARALLERAEEVGWRWEEID